MTFEKCRFVGSFLRFKNKSQKNRNINRNIVLQTIVKYLISRAFRFIYINKKSRSLAVIPR